MMTTRMRPHRARSQRQTLRLKMWRCKTRIHPLFQRQDHLKRGDLKRNGERRWPKMNRWTLKRFPVHPKPAHWQIMHQKLSRAFQWITIFLHFLCQLSRLCRPKPRERAKAWIVRCLRQKSWTLPLLPAFRMERKV